MRSAKQLLHDDASDKFVSIAWAKLRCRSILKSRETNDPFDYLLGDKVRCELKSAKPQSQNGIRCWKFNIHRHNRVAVNGTDFYCLYMNGVAGFKCGVWLVIPYEELSPKIRTVWVSERSLLLRWNKWYNRWDLIKEKLRG